MILLHFEILLGAQFFVEELLSPLVVGLHAIQIGLVVFQRGLHGADVVVGGVHACLGGGRLSFGRCKSGPLGFDVGRRLHVLDLGKELAFADAVAFLHQELRNVALGVGADIDVVFGFNLAGSRDQAGKILADRLAGLHGDQTFLAINGAGVNADSGQQ